MCDICNPVYDPRRQCSLCRDPFTNTNPIAMTEESGQAMCYECARTHGEHHAERFYDEEWDIGFR